MAEQPRERAAHASDQAINIEQHRDRSGVVDQHAEQVAIVAGDLESTPLGHVSCDDDDAVDGFVVELTRTQNLDVPPRSVGGANSDVDWTPDVLAADRCERHQRHVEVIGMDDLEHVATEPIPHWPAEDPLRGAARVDEDPTVIHDEHCIGQRVKQPLSSGALERGVVSDLGGGHNNTSARVSGSLSQPPRSPPLPRQGTAFLGANAGVSTPCRGRCLPVAGSRDESK